MINIDFRSISGSPSPLIVTPFMSLTGQKTTDNQPITDAALLPVPQFFNSIMQLKKRSIMSFPSIVNIMILDCNLAFFMHKYVSGVLEIEILITLII